MVRSLIERLRTLPKDSKDRQDLLREIGALSIAKSKPPATSFWKDQIDRIAQYTTIEKKGGFNKNSAPYSDRPYRGGGRGRGYNQQYNQPHGGQGEGGPEGDDFKRGQHKQHHRNEWQ